MRDSPQSCRHRPVRAAAVCLAMLSLCLAVRAEAQEETPEAAPAASADLTLDLGTNYVWRGLRLSDGLVSQFEAEGTFKGLAVGVWSNYDPREYPKDSGSRKRITETDLTFSYGRAWGSGTFTGGLIYYALSDARDTSELFAGYELDLPLSPSATIYLDADEGDGGFLVLAAGQSLPLSAAIPLDLGVEASIDLGNKVMGTDDEGQGFTGFYHAEVSAETTVPIGRGVGLAARLAVSFPLGSRAGDTIAGASYDGATRTNVYASAGLTVGF